VDGKKYYVVNAKIVVTFFSADLKAELEFKGTRYSCAMMEYIGSANSKSSKSGEDSQPATHRDPRVEELDTEIPIRLNARRHRSPEVAELEAEIPSSRRDQPRLSLQELAEDDTRSCRENTHIFELSAGNDNGTLKPRKSFRKIFGSFRKKT
jgi:hypothetical protein